jgi:hypothetical protein
MKQIFPAFSYGLKGSLGTWKGALIIWLASFVFLELVKFPLRGALNTGLGFSMATEKLADGIDMEVLGDIGITQLGNIVFSMVRSVTLAWFFSFLLNIFLTGGVFDYLKNTTNRFSFPSFFSASARNFKSFFLIRLLSGLLLSALFVFIYLFITLFNLSDSLGIKIIVIALALVLFLLFIQILAVMDYARAKKALNPDLKGTKALGMGFKTVFSNFLPFFSVIVSVSAIQLIVVVVAIKGIISWVPESGFAVFVLFVATQLLYLINVHFKIWRFGTVTDLMRQISVNSDHRQKNAIQVPRIEDDIIELSTPEP